MVSKRSGMETAAKFKALPTFEFFFLSRIKIMSELK